MTIPYWVHDSEYMLSFIFVIVRGLFEWKRICAGCSLFVYISIVVGDPIIKRGLGSHLPV